MIYIWTDGSCDNKIKEGGCGIVLKYEQYEQYYSLGKYIRTTSARAEIRAVLEALRLITNKNLPVTLYCDNQYVVRSISMKWAYKWESENWIDSKSNFPGNKRKNYDLFIQLLEEIRKFTKIVEFVWVKGHSGNYYNEMCDILADNGRKSKKIIDDSKRI